MRLKRFEMLTLVSVLAMAGCDNLTPEQRTVVGVAGGAAAGTLVAQNYATDRCAYARGDGTYYTAPCP